MPHCLNPATPNYRYRCHSHGQQATCRNRILSGIDGVITDHPTGHLSQKHPIRYRYIGRSPIIQQVTYQAIHVLCRRYTLHRHYWVVRWQRVCGGGNLGAFRARTCTNQRQGAFQDQPWRNTKNTSKYLQPERIIQLQLCTCCCSCVVCHVRLALGKCMRPAAWSSLEDLPCKELLTSSCWLR